MIPGMLHEINQLIKELMLERSAVGEQTLMLKNLMAKRITWDQISDSHKHQIEILYRSVVNDYIEHFNLFLQDPDWEGNLYN